MTDIYHIKSSKGKIFVHHLDVHQRPPCYGCYGNSHAQMQYTVRDPEQVKAKTHLTVTLPRVEWSTVRDNTANGGDFAVVVAAIINSGTGSEAGAMLEEQTKTELHVLKQRRWRWLLRRNSLADR